MPLSVTVGGEPITPEEATALLAALAAGGSDLGADIEELSPSDRVIALREGVPRPASMAAVAAFIGEGPSATVPAAITAGQWTAVAGNNTITVDITTLPDDGGSPITALQYRIDEGSPVAFEGTGTGVRSITGLSNGTPLDLQIRAVNAVDADPDNWSDTKTRTPAAVAPPPPPGMTFLTSSDLAGWNDSFALPVPVGTAIGDRLVIQMPLYGNTITSMPSGFVDITPASWSGSDMKLIMGPPISGSVPSTVAFVLSGSQETSWTMHALRGASTAENPVSASGTGASPEGWSTDPHTFTYTTPAAGNFVLGFVDFSGGGVTGADPEEDLDRHVWTRLGAYASRYAAVVAAAGADSARLAPVGAGSGGVHHWATLSPAA
jgi:hypothetical protein